MGGGGGGRGLGKKSKIKKQGGAFIWHTRVSSGAAIRRCFVKKLFLKISQNSQESTCARVSFLACNFIKKEALTQVFPCEFCEIFKNTFFYRTPPVADSVNFYLLFCKGKISYLKQPSTEACLETCQTY